MNSDLYFDGKQYISSSRAAKISGYVNDYIGQLCRDGKLECRMVGRSWYVSFESLISHKNANGGNAKSKIKKTWSYSPVALAEKTETKETLPADQTYREVSTKTFKPEISRTPELNDSTSANLSNEFQSFISPKVSISSSSTELKSHHAAFEKKFPRIVVSMVAFLFVISIFQSTLMLNKNAELAYQNFGNVIKDSLSEVFPSNNIFSANVTVGTQSGFDRFAISFYKVVHGILFDTRETIIVLFGGEVPEEEKPLPHLAQAPQSATDGQGMVVVPVEVKTDQDAVIAKIKDSFSDEVNVLPREDGVSGVITPVFKKAANDDYLYVLVPIKN